MLNSVKDVLTKEINLKEVLTKEIEMDDVKKVLLMEIEIEKLKDLLETEVKMKEFLLTEINIKDFLSRPSTQKKNEPTDDILHVQDIDGNDVGEKNVKEVGVESQNDALQKKLLPPFDYGLIETLRNDHQEICFSFDQMMKLAKDKKYTLAAELLDSYTNRIRAHYQRADVGLYSYLKCYIQQKYPKREKAFNELSLEMKNISIEIFYSISQSVNIPLCEETHEAFIKEFEVLGNAMKDRVKREETVLFKMYEESHEIKNIS